MFSVVLMNGGRENGHKYVQVSLIFFINQAEAAGTITYNLV